MKNLVIVSFPAKEGMLKATICGEPHLNNFDDQRGMTKLLGIETYNFKSCFTRYKII